ncbi:transposase family protein [Scytonema sp. PCC 10023]
MGTEALWNKELTAEQKQKNKELSSERILIEHLICLVKIFRVLKKDFG